jgi:protein-tyrosine phosphatase
VEQDFYDFDYIIAMDDSNMANISAIKPETKLNVTVLKMRHYDPLHKNANVKDPWFGGEKGFEEVFQILKRSCHNFYDELIG